MLHLESYLSALKIKGLTCLFDDIFRIKKIEEIYFDHNVLHAILLSNIKLTSKSFEGVFPLRSLLASFSLLQNSNIINCKNSDTFLWFNKHLKNKGKPLKKKEFSHAGC